MLFSDYFNVTKSGQESWFDPILDDDTLLFVDPFLIYLEQDSSFENAYQKIMIFFQSVFLEAANIPANLNSPKFKVLLNKVVFKEPREACLGFSVGSVDGAGSGSGFAKIILLAIYDSINAGINNLSHFEELGIFSSNIKEDRISDVTINILKHEFIGYTQEICKELNIETKMIPCRVFEETTNRWVYQYFDLPENPFNAGPVLLIPKRFLTTINALNSDDFLGFVWRKYDGDIKDQFNVDIKSSLDKKAIIDIARSHPNWVGQYMNFKEEEKAKIAYDLELDPDGIYGWQKYTESFVSKNPLLSVVIDKATFLYFIKELSEKFNSLIEGDYNLLLLKSGRTKTEKASQLLLYGLVKNYCRSIGCKVILADGAGKGICSFIFNSGYENEAFFEVKHGRNKGIIKTLHSYLLKQGSNDEIIYGYFFVVCFKQSELVSALTVEEDILAISAEHNYQIKFLVIDNSIS